MEANLDMIYSKLDELVSYKTKGALTVKEAAHYLSVSTDFLYGLIRNREIRFKRKGAGYLFKREWLDEWLDGKYEMEDWEEI